MRRLVPLTFCCLLLWVGQAISATAHDVTVSSGGDALSYSPASVTVAIGDSVHWTWAFSHHSVTSNSGSAESFDSGILNSAATFDHTFNKVGTFAYHCVVHGLGMAGSVTVPGIAGHAFDDLNGNGVADAGEPGLAGATVDLSSSNTPVASTQTDANGNYQFADHGSATYDLTFTPPAGYTDTSGTNPITGITYNTGDVSTGNDFFAQSSRTISGTVYNDLNGNGAADGGEVGKSAVAVFLDSNNDGIRQSTEQQVQTDGLGAYSLVHVPAGVQHVAIAVPSTFDATGPSARTVQPGGPDTGVDFFVASGNASIHGTVHDDTNGNGAADAGEGVLASVTVGLDSTGDGLADRSIATASDGTYSFGGLTARTYKVIFNAPSGYAATGPVAYNEVLAHGQSKTGVDFFAQVPPQTVGTGGQTTDQNPPEEPPLNFDLLGGTKGTNGSDALDGTGKADKILGLAGDDLILGFGGNDYLDGGTGDDSIDGGTGNDKLYGRAGNDRLRGGPGNDRLVGGPGLDRLYGGPGNDVLIGGKGEDFYFGGSGNDVINSADGVAERIDCGTGRKDRAIVDRKDHTKNCEKVTRRR